MVHGLLILLFFLLLGASTILIIFIVINKLLMASRSKELAKNIVSITEGIDTFITRSDDDFRIALDKFYINAVARGKAFINAVDSYLLSSLETPDLRHKDRFISIANRFNFPANSLAQIKSGNIRVIALGSRRAGLYNYQEAVDEMIIALEILSSENQFEILMGLARIGKAEDMQRAFEKIKDSILVNERAVIAILGAFPKGEEKRILFRNMIHCDTDYVSALFLKSMDRGMAGEMMEDIISVFTIGSDEIRVSAIQAFASLGEDAPEGILIKALEDSDWEVRALAAKALGQIKTKESSAALYKALFDQQWWIRQNVAHALLGHPGFETLFVLAAESGDEYTKDSIISVLENANNPALLRAIKRMVV